MDPITMLVIGLVVGLVVGYIIGRFGKKIMQMLREALKKKQDKDKSDDEDAAALQDEEGDWDDPDKTEEMLQEFMNLEQNPGIDDNPEMEFNPIFDYLIKRQKELDRIEFLRKRAEEEGTTLEELNETAVAPGQRQNALATLISVGARVTPMFNAESAAAIAQKEARCRAKNIETYLTKTCEVDCATFKRDDKKRMGGKKVMSAYEKALSTQENRVDGVRAKVEITAAKHSRDQLREQLRLNPHLGGSQKFERRGAEKISMADLATIQDELENEAMDDDNEEEGDEDAEDEQLGA